MANTPNNIHVLVVIDTVHVKKIYGKQGTPEKPHPINHIGEYMLVTGSPSVSAQGTADVTFTANLGDYVSFHGTSVFGQTDDAILIYGIRNTEQVFNKFTYNGFTLNGAVLPDISKDNGLPALHSRSTFYSFESRVIRTGKDLFNLQFALYERDGENQNIYGYYEWDPTIIVP